MAYPEPAHQLATAVRAAFIPAADYLAQVIRSNPDTGIAVLLRRPDVSTALGGAFTAALERALQAVEEAWGEQPPDAMLRDLLGDVGASYNDAALAHLHGDIRTAWFRPGASRSREAREAVMDFARRTGLRNTLSANMAAGVATTLAALDSALPGTLKRWRAHVDRPTCCAWCRKLNGVTIPLHQSFASHLGGPVDLTGHGHLTQPPNPYRGWLQGPKLHPWCQCWLEFVAGDDVSQETAGQEIAVPPGFLSATEVRALPEDVYAALLAFVRAASHELGQVLRRLRGLVRRG